MTERGKWGIKRQVGYQAEGDSRRRVRIVVDAANTDTPPPEDM